ncbi:unnamed protein product [Lactuca virosa]|uniref:Chalcone-flavonone isomerase family protein n=1 Tax=Lactuca virosa TaxID=75947 RepID=A0AAU9PN01_9ASTR|nr:unnamed protein product [Lactuca virosa]
MAPPPSPTSLEIEYVVFPPAIKPPGATTTLILTGARINSHIQISVIGMEIEGNFVKFTGIGVYLEDKAIPSLAVKWNGKTAAELTDSVEFFRDIVTGIHEIKNKNVLVFLAGNETRDIKAKHGTYETYNILLEWNVEF